MYEDNNKIQRLMMFDDEVGTAIVEVFEIKNNEINLINYLDHLNVDSILDDKETINWTVLKGPLKVNNSWTVEELNQKFKITSTNKFVDLGEGFSDCIEVSIFDLETNVMTETMYFSKGNGLIKHIYLSTSKKEVDQVVVDENEIETSFELYSAVSGFDLDEIKNNIEELKKAQAE